MSEEKMFRNYYRCEDCGEEWTDKWSCMCDDRCPSCRTEMTPYKSEELETAEPEVRKFLTVSASHLPQDFADRLDDQARNGRGFQDREFGFWPFAGEYGWFLYAPTEIDLDADIPESVARLLAYAREQLGCSFVLFDRDGDVLDGFATCDKADTDT